MRPADGLTFQGEMLERTYAERYGESSRVKSSLPIANSPQNASRSPQHVAAKPRSLRVCFVRCPLSVVRCPLSAVRSIYYQSWRFWRSWRPRSHCYPTRQALTLIQVDLSCGTTNALLSVSEPEKCEYRFKVTSPALCYPLEEGSGGGASGAVGIKPEL
jgi:hypothetical protein